MKKLYVIILSVMLLALVGCSSADQKSKSEDISQEESEMTAESELATASEASVAEKTDTETKPKDSKTENEKSETGADAKEAEPESGTKTESKENPSEQRKDTTATTEARADAQTTVQTQQPAATTTETTSEPEYTPAGYNPGTVVSLAISKCQAGGMITTQDNLANALAEGRITQEEYNEYYPYDGLDSSYYSVFVETDLNTASTTSGQPLRSEDAIATYIANMLLLESSPVFNVVYAGVYTKNGTDFYEFRCLR